VEIMAPWAPYSDGFCSLMSASDAAAAWTGRALALDTPAALAEHARSGKRLTGHGNSGTGADSKGMWS
jgi:hypothetical protein